MPLIAALVGALEWATGSFVVQVLISLGISFATYGGIDTMITGVKADALAAFGSMGGVTAQLLGVLQVGTSINIICSAYVTKTVMMGITGGKLTKMITKV